MKRIFPIGPNKEALKLDKGRVLGGWQPPLPPPLSKSLPIFLTMKMTSNLDKFWYEVKQYQGKFVKKIRDNTIKDNVTVTSSNFSLNDGTIRILTHFLAKKIIVNYTINLTCAF